MLGLIEKYLWIITSVLLLTSGIYFSIKLRYQQFNIKKIINILRKNSLSTLNLTLAAKIGVGSLAGVALAIYTGGIGTIFWMWISALICAPITYSECYLSVINRKKEKNLYYGGPSTYIKNKKLSIIYSVFLIIAYTCGFITIQVNTITKTLSNQISPIIFGLIIAIIACPIIFYGIKGITRICNYLVPIMSLTYLIVCLIIIINNFSSTVLIIIKIIKEAIYPKSFVGLLFAFIIGIQRGIFSNESGIGTSAISASQTTLTAKDEGYMQIVGVYISTLVICTITAIVIILSDFNKLNILNPNGIEITYYAFSYHMGNFGTTILTITIILFGLSTIITGYYYSESNLKLLINSKTSILILKIASLVLIVLGSVINSALLWIIIDIFVALMSIINVLALIQQRHNVKI